MSGSRDEGAKLKALRTLKWRPIPAAEDDTTLRAVEAEGWAYSTPVRPGEREWRITAEGVDRLTAPRQSAVAC